ncbi:MAG TPA: DUF6807 family protein [Caldilineaceae bacterium]|nr:DUF6807 family protein [Caldilineaceae bacterium]
MSYTTFYYNARWWVRWGDRLLGGYSANGLRSYVFPLYSPAGMLVLQEAPPDHPHHQGVWVGLEINGYDLWNAGSRRLPGHRQEAAPALPQLQPDIGADGVRFAHEVHWRTEGGDELLRERRTVVFRAGGAPGAMVTVVEWASTFYHPTQAVHLGQTKEAGVGLRVPPHWETVHGGRIRNAWGDTGEAGAFDKLSPWLNIEGRAAGDAVAGLLFAPLPKSEPCPWFTRDYGVHVYNPARHRAIELAPNEPLTWAVQVIAYDGRRSVDELERLVAQAQMAGSR